MQDHLTQKSWNILDALIVLATLTLSRDATRMVLSYLSRPLDPGVDVLLQALGSALGLFIVHTVMEHRYYNSRLTIRLSLEKPLWYLQVALIAGTVLFSVCTLGYTMLLRAVAPGAGGVAFASEIAGASAPWGLAALTLGLAGVFPWVVETAFRGYLYLSLEAHFGNAPALVLSALAFSLVLFDLWLVPPLFAAGILLVLVYEMTSSLFAPVFSVMIWQLLSIVFIRLF